MTNDFDSINDSDVLFVIGSNTTETHPVIGSFLRERARDGAKLIVCDPRKIELAHDADIHIQHKIGSDVALLNAMMHVIIKENLQDKTFVEERTEGFSALADAVKAWTPERASEITGVDACLIREAARIYAGGKNSAVFYTMGITQHISGTDNVRALANLAMLCGMIGRKGVGVNPLRGQNNVQGSCDMGCLPNDAPGYQKVSNPEVREKFKNLLGYDIPEKPGKSVVEIMNAASDGEIKAVFIMGENPMVSDPDTNHIRHALEKLDFLVVQDIFLTETAQLADVVLPAACWGEKDGTTTNTCRTVQRVRRAVTPPGEARPDWRILTELAREFGLDWRYSSPSEIFDEIAKVTPQYAGISYSRIEHRGIPWPCLTADSPGTPILHVGKFARGKGKFQPVEWHAPHESLDAEYPFIANTGRILWHYHTGSMTRRSATVKFINKLQIEINPKDAIKLSISSGDMVRVSSRRGSVEGEAFLTDRTPNGALFVPFHFGESPANMLTSSEIDPASGTPAYKFSAVKLEKA